MCLPECGLSRHMRSGDLWLCVGAFHGIDFIIYYNTSIDSRQLATCCRLWLFHLLFERSQKKTSSLVSDSETTHWRQPMIDCDNLSADHSLVGHQPIENHNASGHPGEIIVYRSLAQATA